MKPADVLFTAGALAIGAWAGEALGRLPGAIIGGLLGVLIGVGVALLGIRLGVAVPVLTAMVAGGVLGRGIVHALCLPGSCRGAEMAATLLTGLGSLVAVGLVVALVARSFDEYKESRAQSPEPRQDQ